MPTVAVARVRTPELLVVRRRGVPPVVYLNMPRLDSAIGRGARLSENLPRLAAECIPIVYHWRPGTPASDTAEVMQRLRRAADEELITARCAPAGDT